MAHSYKDPLALVKFSLEHPDLLKYFEGPDKQAARESLDHLLLGGANASGLADRLRWYAKAYQAKEARPDHQPRTPSERWLEVCQGQLLDFIKASTDEYPYHHCANLIEAITFKREGNSLSKALWQWDQRDAKDQLNKPRQKVQNRGVIFAENPTTKEVIETLKSQGETESQPRSGRKERLPEYDYATWLACLKKQRAAMLAAGNQKEVARIDAWLARVEKREQPPQPKPQPDKKSLVGRTVLYKLENELIPVRVLQELNSGRGYLLELLQDCGSHPKGERAKLMWDEIPERIIVDGKLPNGPATDEAKLLARDNEMMDKYVLEKEEEWQLESTVRSLEKELKQKKDLFSFPPE